METRRLQYFVQIAEAGSINRAAAALGIAQPALSQQLAILETELKARLFTRSHAGVVLTDAGHTLYSRANRILRQFEALTQDLAVPAGSIGGMLTIGMPPTLVIPFGLGLVETMLAEHPRLKLHLLEASVNELADCLHGGTIDMALLAAASPSLSVMSKPLMREELFLVSRWADGPLDTTPAELAKLPWVVTRFPHMLRSAIAAWFQQAGYEPRVIAEVNSIRLMQALVERGLGVTLAPRAALAEAEAEGKVRLTSLDPKVYRSLSLCIRAERSASLAVAAVEAWLHGRARELHDPAKV